MAYMEGLRFGSGVVRDLFRDASSESKDEREWQARLASGSQARADKMAELKAAKEKQRYEEFESGVRMDQAQGKQSWEMTLGARKQTEDERHNKAMEWRPVGGRGVGGLSSTVMTPAQATSAIREIQMRYPRKAGQEMPELGDDDFMRVEELKAIQTPGYKAQSRSAKPPTWWQRNAPEALGGMPAASAPSLTPGARSALGL